MWLSSPKNLLVLLLIISNACRAAEGNGGGGKKSRGGFLGKLRGKNAGKSVDFNLQNSGQDNKIMASAEEDTVKLAPKIHILSKRPELPKVPLFEGSGEILNFGGEEELSKVYLNTYDMSPHWNRLFGRRFPIYHSSVTFQGPAWTRTNPRTGEVDTTGTEFEIGGLRNAMKHRKISGLNPFKDNKLKEEVASGKKQFRLIESKFMGQTDMPAREIRRLAYNELGKKYAKYNLVNRNCNQCAEDFLTRTLGRRPSKRNDRLARGLNRRLPFLKKTFFLG